MEQTNKKRAFSFNKKKIGDNIFVIGMLAIPLLHFCVFWIYQNFGSLAMAFQQLDSEGNVYFTMENFKNVIHSFSSTGNVLTIGIKNTIITWIYSLFIAFPFGFVLSYFMYKKIMGYKLFRVVFYLPQIISGVALVALFKYCIGSTGPVGILWGMTHDRIPNFLGESEYALWTTLVYCFWSGFCGQLIYFSGAMSSISTEMMEAATIDGVTMKDEFFRFIIPLCWPTLSTLITFQLIGVLGSSGPTLLLTQGKADTYTLSYWLYEQVLLGNSLYMPSALGWLMTLVTLPIVLVVRYGMKILDKKFDY